MRPRIWIIILATVFVSAAVFAQSKGQAPYKTPVARLSYHNSWPVHEQEGSPDICFALYSDGYYQMRRQATRWRVEVVQGTLPQTERVHLEQMLNAPDFESSNRPIGSMVRQGAEDFAAEILRAGAIRQFTWIDPDRQRPFPASASKVVDWLQHFKAEGATPLNLGERSICPAKIRPLDPSLQIR